MGRRARSFPGSAVAAVSIAAMLAVSACSAGPQSVGIGAPNERAQVQAPAEAAPSSVSKSVARGVYSGQPPHMTGAVPSGGPSPADKSKVAATERLIIRNKTIRIEAAKVSAAVDKIRQLASATGSDITQMRVATADQPVYRPAGDGQPSDQSNLPLQAYVTVRVPAAKYQAFVDGTVKIGTVLYQAEDTDDVTQQHIDLSARLANLKAEAARLRQFFDSARSVNDMLNIERELTRVQGDIESMAAQVAFLERQAAMATVTLEITEPKPLLRPSGIDWGVGSAFTQSIRAFVSTMNMLIVVLGPVLALLVFIGLPVTLVFWLVWRRRKRQVADLEVRDTASGEQTTP